MAGNVILCTLKSPVAPRNCDGVCESMIKLLIVVCLMGIILSLGTGLFHLVKDKGDSKRMVNALTVRIALSVALFVLLFIAWKQGLIQPHGIVK